MTIILDHQWIIFIIIEMSSLLFLLSFIVVRYVFTRIRFSYTFLLLFLFTIVLEAVLAYLVYHQTGEVTTFQIVIVIFVVYAGTFGIHDFKKLDRYAKEKIGQWKGIDLLTEKDRVALANARDPNVIARRARYFFYAHAIIFLVAICLFWQYDGNNRYHFIYFIKHVDWFHDELVEPRPFHSEMITNIVQLWMILFVIDSVINWSYTFFPDKKG